MQLFPTSFGHVGVFIEQEMHWRWLTNLPLHGLKLLNLFAYTGGATLAAAAAQAQITHVDSAKTSVRRASGNAELSHMKDRTIRWIVEDAAKFVRREKKRGNRYDGVILDPPTYGHGTNGRQSWKIEQDLTGLLRDLRDIVPECRLMLFTCHTMGYPARFLADSAADFAPAANAEQGGMTLRSTAGRPLHLGSYVRWFQ